MKVFPLEKSWNQLLGQELDKSYMHELMTFLDKEAKSGKTLYPQSQDIFAALNLTPFDQVKVVILGQDPYHGPNQAHGLCFSVKPGVKPPPSLVNIFKEFKEDLGLPVPDHGNLAAWAKQGVLLLNNVLTVEDGKAGSHHLKGWEEFTSKIIDLLNEKKDESSGIGLANVKRRLELLYPTNHSLVVNDSEADFEITLTIKHV